MRKLGTLFSVFSAVVASLALAGPASALLSAEITGPNTPGTNTYTITMTFATGDGGGIRGVVSSVTTTGTYTGVFTDGPGGTFPTNLGGPAAPAGTGVHGSWGFVAGTPQAGQTVVLGTVQITVAPGDVVNPFFTSLDGFVTNSFSTVQPLAGNITGVTIIPEPTTASLLALGIVGLVLAGRKSRA